MRVYGLVSQRLFPNFLHTKGVKDRGLDFFDDSNWRSIGSEVRSYTFNWDFSNGISKFSVPLEEKSNPTAPAAWLVNLFLELLRWSCFGLFMPHGMWSIGECDILRGKISHLVVWQFGGQGKHGHAADTQGVRSQICCGESPRALGQRVPLGDQKILTLEATAKHMLSCGSWALVLCSSKVMPWAFARTPTERGSLSPCPPFAVGLKMREVWTIQHWRNGLLGCITLQSAQRFQACLERYGHECTSFWIQSIEVKSSYWESSDLSIFCAGRSLIL